MSQNEYYFPRHFIFFFYLWVATATGFLLLPHFCLADNAAATVEAISISAPAGLTATAISDSRIDLSWSAVSEAVSYKVYRDGTLTASPTANSYSDTGLSPATAYSYTVSAVSISGGESTESSSASATTLAAPSSGGGGGMPSQWYNPPQEPEGGFRISIDNGASETNDLSVELSLTGGIDTVRMAISNFSDFRDAGQETYQTSKSWNLCQGRGDCPEGEYAVYTRFYASWGTASVVISDSIIYRKKVAPPIEIIEKISEQAKEISEKAREIAQKIVELFRPKPPEEKPIEIPVEELVPREASLAFKGKWLLLTYTIQNKPFVKFTLAPIPIEFQKLAQKFPGLEKTFTEVGIQQLIDIEELKSAELTLPGLTERVGLPTTKVEPGKFALPTGVPIAQLSPQIKEKIPTEVVFAKAGGELIDFNIALSVTEKGKTEQKITTVSGKQLNLTVKPEKPVKSVKGYVIFKAKKVKSSSLELPLNVFSASLLFANPVFAQEHNPAEIEEVLVLMEFEYTDPDGDGIYTANIQAPVVEGEYEIITVMDYEDPTLGQKEIRLVTVVDPEGYVYEKTGNRETRIPGAIVSLFWLNSETKQYELWPAKEYQQENPQITDTTGKYSFLVPLGSYYLKVDAPGYSPYDGRAFQVGESSGIHVNIELKTKYWWLNIVDWKTLLLILVILLLVYNFYRDRMRERKSRRSVTKEEGLEIPRGPEAVPSGKLFLEKTKFFLESELKKFEEKIEEFSQREKEVEEEIKIIQKEEERLQQQEKRDPEKEKMVEKQRWRLEGMQEEMEKKRWALERERNEIRQKLKEINQNYKVT